MKTKSIILIFTLLLIAGKVAGQCDVTKVVSGTGTICSGTSTNISVAASDATASYQLRDGITPVGIAVAGTGGSIDLPTGPLLNTTTFNIFVTGTTPVCSAQLNETEIITVTPIVGTPVFSLGATSSRCQGAGTVTYTATATNNTGITYALDVTTAGFAGNSINTGTGEVTYAAGWSGTTTITATATGCGGPSTANHVATISALPLTTYTVGGGGSYCSGGSGVSITLSDSEADVTYELFKDAAATGTTITGTGSALSFNSVTAAGTYTIKGTRSPGCVTTMSGDATITINALPNSTYTVGGGGSYCSGGSGVSITLSDSESGVDYELFLNAGATGTILSGTGSPLSFNVTAAGTYTIKGTNATPCTSTMSGSTTVTINALPVAGAITGGTAVCMGSTLALTSNASGTATLTYTWDSSDGTKASVSNAGLVTPIAVGNTNITYTVTDGNSCQATSPVNTVTVNPLPAAITGELDVCISSTTDLDNATGGGTWTSDNTTVATINSTSGVVSGLSAGTSLITYTVAGCSVTTTVTVDPAGQVDDPADQVLCNGATTNLVDFTTILGGGVTTFYWANDQTSINLAGSGTGDISPFTVTNTGNSPVTATITVTPHYKHGNVTCIGTPQTFTITVNPTPTINSAASKTICNNSSVNYDITTPTAGAITYTWTSSITTAPTGGTITGFSNCSLGCGTNIGQTLINTGTSPGVVRYRITPTGPATTNCPGSQFDMYVTVNPAAQVNDPADFARCHNTSASVTFSTLTSGGTTTYDWTNSNTDIGLVASGTGNISSFTATNPGTVPITATITVTPSFEGCTGTPQTFVITVNPLPTLSGVSQAAQICSGTKATINLTGLIGTSSTVTYQIGTDAPVTKTGIVVTGGNASFQTGDLAAVNNGKSLTINSIINENTGCTATFTQSTLLIVNTATVPVITGDLTPCINSSVTYTTQSGMNAGTYIWTFSGGGTYTGGGTNDNTITVNWTSSGPQTITVNFTNSNGCTAASSTPANLEVSALPTPVINGPASVCINSSGNVYTTLAGMSEYDWEITGGTINSGGDNSNVAVVTWTNTGPQNITVNYENESGCMAATPTSLGVSVNPLPVPTFVTAPTIVRVTSTGNVYSTQSSMNSYVWTVSGGGAVTGGGTAVSDFVTVTWNTTGSQNVSVRYTNTNNCTAAGAATANVTVNALPSVSGVNISGTPAVGYTLTGNYTYSDNGGGNSLSTFRWLRNGTPVPGEVLSTYLLTGDDLNKAITFEVTPVSTVGPPNTGVVVVSAPTIPIENLSEIPVADQVCIEGRRAAGETLRGKYRYIHSKPEGATTYKWYLNGVAIPSATGIQYTLLSTDIDNNEEITFEVTPVSSNVIPVNGSAVPSDPLVKIPLLPNEYSVAVISVPLAATPAGGIFSGPGVTNGVFSPNSVGISVTPYTIQYLKTYVNSFTSCSQVVTKNVTVVANTTGFSSFKPVYCNDDLPDEIIVTGLPAGATSVGFSLTDPDAIVSETDWTVTIDPRKMLPGNNVDVLYFSYKDASGSEYQISKTFVVDAVGTSIQILNLSDEYCDETPKTEITVTGATPSGGIGDWTGSGIIIIDLAAVSASVNVEPGTPGKKYAVVYQYTTPLGCKSAILKDSVKVNPLPDPSFSLDNFYNFDGEDVPLIPVQSPGTFTGKGVVSGDRFSPAKAGLGERTINYYIKDSNGCSDDLNLKTTILKAEGTITGIPSVICYSDTTYNVTIPDPLPGITVTGFYNSKNTMIHTPGSLSAEYSVTAAGEGIDTVTFSYQLDGVDYWITKEIYVDKLDKVEIYGISPGDKICDNRPYTNLELNTSKPGGIFTGQVLGNYIDPTKGVGDTFVTYTYTNTTDGISCSTSTTVPFTVIPAPVVSFVPRDVCIESGNSTDSTFFVNNTVSSDPVREWIWTFEKDAPTSGRKEPGFLYKTGGIHGVSLEVWTISGCNVKQASNIDLGIKPKADFTWVNDCYSPGEILRLSDATVTNLLIISQTWSFTMGNETRTSSGSTAQYEMRDTGFVDVNYTVTTNYDNCADVVSRRVYLRPTITIPADGFYYQNFEAGKAGWIEDDTDTKSSWKFGTPDRTIINKAASGTAAWYTKYESDKQGIPENSSIISPCFDFTDIQRPMITLQAFKIFEKNRNGAALQYKTEGSDWKYVGTEDDGINWYNSTLINGKPGGEKIGWTTLSEEKADADYVPSSHELDALKGKKNVKFRLAYGSDGNSLDKEGIAFDDIWIGERTRKVLLEHFTNTFSRKGSEATAFVNKITKTRNKDVVNIQYHTNFPDDDPFYLLNPGDASARIFSYGLSKVPYSLIDGGYSNDLYASLSDYKSAPLDSNDLSRRTLLDSKFAISLTPVVTGGILTVESTVTAANAFSSDFLVLYLAVTEKEAISDKPAALGEVLFMNVFRKFIPDAGGIDLKKTWTKGETFSISGKTWLIENIKNFSDIEVIAFIQNSQTKEVYQVYSVILETGKSVIDNSKLNKNATGTENKLLLSVITFGLYPNPAADKLKIEFSDKLVSETDIRIFDFQGAVKKSYKVASGESDLFIEDLGLKAGIYLVRISSGGVDLGFRKLIITGN